MRTTKRGLILLLVAVLLAVVSGGASGCGGSDRSGAVTSSTLADTTAQSGDNAMTSDHSDVATTSTLADTTAQSGNIVMIGQHQTTGVAEDPLTAQKIADIVVYGEVVKIDPGRWNSADGNYAVPDDPSGMSIPAVYCTFYVEPVELLKGAPKWGTPIAFIVVGRSETQVSVGGTVLVFGSDYMARGGLYGEVYWRENSHFAMAADESAYVLKDGRLTKSIYVREDGTVAGALPGDVCPVVSLAAVRQAIADQEKGIDSRTPRSYPTTTTVAEAAPADR